MILSLFMPDFLPVQHPSGRSFLLLFLPQSFSFFFLRVLGFAFILSVLVFPLRRCSRGRFFVVSRKRKPATERDRFAFLFTTRGNLNQLMLSGASSPIYLFLRTCEIQDDVVDDYDDVGDASGSSSGFLRSLWRLLPPPNHPSRL